MPIFEYRCSKCHATLELLQKEPEAPLICDHCGASGTLEKTVSAPAGFKLKGTGWYQTDFKGK